MESVSSVSFSDALQTLLGEFYAATDKNLTPQLDKIVEDIAKTGLTCYPWEHLKHLLGFKLNLALDEHNSRTPVEGFDDKKALLLKTLYGFHDPPFTIQRLCELLVRPHFYANTHKYLFAVDKVLTVTTTQETLLPDAYNSLVAAHFAAMMQVKSPADGTAPSVAPGAEKTIEFGGLATVQIPTTNTSAESVVSGTSGADSMEVDSQAGTASANVAEGAPGTDQPTKSEGMEVDTSKDSDAMDVDKQQ